MYRNDILRYLYRFKEKQEFEEESYVILSVDEDIPFQKLVYFFFTFEILVYYFECLMNKFGHEVFSENECEKPEVRYHIKHHPTSKVHFEVFLDG